MNLFQILALAFLTLLLLMTLVAAGKRWVTRREAVTWSAVWVIAGLAILWPSATGAIAKKLGIGRGADLLLYCAVVVMMVGFLMIYVRMRRLRSELTLLVRHLAIRDAVASPPADEQKSASPAEGSPSS